MMAVILFLLLSLILIIRLRIQFLMGGRLNWRGTVMNCVIDQLSHLVQSQLK